MFFVMKLILLVSVLQYSFGNVVAANNNNNNSKEQQHTRILESSVFNDGGGEGSDTSKGGATEVHKSNDNTKCQDVPSDGCSVCGEGKCVTNKDAIFHFPGQPAVACSMLQEAGYQGLVPTSECSFLPPLIGICECNTSPNATSSPSSSGIGAGGAIGISVAILALVTLCVGCRIKCIQCRSQKHQLELDVRTGEHPTFDNGADQQEGEEEEPGTQAKIV